jgi:N-acylneuraminate cytidylyltransferase
MDFARGSKCFDKIIVSTDSGLIAEIASNGVIAESYFSSLPEDITIQVNDFYLHKRKVSQAQTLSPIRDVLFELSTERIFNSVNLIFMLQPTSPFREIEEMEKLLQLVNSTPKSEFSSVVSVSEVGGFHPDRMFTLSEKRLVPIVDQRNEDNKPRQLLEPMFIKDGAYYVLKKENLKNQIFLGKEIVPFFRSGFKTINIDEENDFELAELVYSNWIR